MHIKLSTVFTFLNCTPNSRCFVEGERVLEAGHVISCGVSEKTNEKWTITAYCVRSSGVKLNPHEIKGCISVKDEVNILNFVCSCKAGASSSCKHIAASLLLCSRKPIEDLEELSCTDGECKWKFKKKEVETKYESNALLRNDCFNKLMARETIVRISKVEREDIFQQALIAAEQSEFSIQLKGRRQQVVTPNFQPLIPDYITHIFQHTQESEFLASLEIDTSAISACCSQFINNKLKAVNITEAMCYEQGSVEWKAVRKARITGTTCYPLYSFHKDDWSVMIRNFLTPTMVQTKEMAHGSEMEVVALTVFEKNNPNYSIKKMGIIINHLFPWLAYSPDGIIFSNGSPQRLLEIKCPYLGKIKSPDEVLPGLPYLNKDLSLKTKHKYYGQIQMGMALLNLQYCEFIVFFSKDANYLQITVPFDPNFTKKLLETASKKYLSNIIHNVCTK